MCKLVQIVLCLQQRTLLIFRVNLAVKTIKLQNNKKMWAILCKFGRNFWYVLWKDFVPSPVAHCSKCSGIRTHRFCFLSHPSLPNKIIGPRKPRNALKLCFYFLLCISRMPNLTATFLLEDCSKIPNVFLCFASQPSKHMDRSTKWQNPEKVDI